MTESIFVVQCDAQGEVPDCIKNTKSAEEYRLWAEFHHDVYGIEILGKSLITSENIGCLCTFYNFDDNIISSGLVLENTRRSITELIENAKILNIYEFQSEKLNLGYFKNDWQKTEIILQEILRQCQEITWQLKN